MDIGDGFQKKASLGLILVISIGAGLMLNSYTSGGNQVDTVDWRSYNLTEVESGEEFTIESLEKPLLIESFAVWCPTCTRQQQEIKKLHENSNITSVSLDVDPNEDQSQILEHKQNNNFDWRYAISPTELTRTLASEFGNSVANPPSAPVILVCENESRRMENGVKTSSKLMNEVEEGC